MTRNPAPLFPSYPEFSQYGKSKFYSSDYPSVGEFVKKISDNVQNSHKDYEWACQFLFKRAGKSEATYNALRSETERFLLWSWLYANKSIPELKKRDIEAYIDFAVKPPKSWVGKSICNRFKRIGSTFQPNTNWRPFVMRSKSSDEVTLQAEQKKYEMSIKTIREIFSNLSIFFNYLLDEEYVGANYLPALARDSNYLSRKDVTNAQVHRLSDEQWEMVLSILTDSADKDPSLEIVLFVIVTMKSLYLRVSELSVRKDHTPTMGNFYMERGTWWFTALGKGNKLRKVTVPDAYLPYLTRYRATRNLPGLPGPKDEDSLLRPQRVHVNGYSARSIAMLVDRGFKLVSDKLIEGGKLNDAKVVLSASTHWLRHTGASMDATTRPIKDLSTDLGHSMQSTTDKIYVHADDARRAESGKSRRV